MENFTIKRTKISNEGQEEKLMFNCTFVNYEDAEKALLETAKKMGYELKYNEDGVVTGAMFVNNKRGCRIILTIDTILCASSYEEFLLSNNI